MKQNQRLSLIKSSRTGLGEKLRQSMSNLIVDVWGLEKKTANSLNLFFEKESITRTLPKEFFTIRISSRDSIKIALFHNNEILYLITTSELLQLLNAPNTNPTDIEKIISKLKQLLNQYGNNHKTVDLCLRIKVTNQKVQLHLMDSREILETIHFFELIKQLSIW